jgi:hypothetical protein
MEWKTKGMEVNEMEWKERPMLIVHSASISDTPWIHRYTPAHACRRPKPSSEFNLRAKITDTLSRRQGRRSEYRLFFRPGKLGEEPGSLTRKVNYYLKGGDRDYVFTNPQNLRLIFIQERLVTSLRATCVQPVASDAATLVDISAPVLHAAALVKGIKVGLVIDPLAKQEIDF